MRREIGDPEDFRPDTADSLPVWCSRGCILDRGLNIPHTADAQDPFVVDMDVLVMPQIVVDPAVALVRAFHMNLFNFLSKLLILGHSVVGVAGSPLVVERTGHMELFAFCLHRIPRFTVAFLDSAVDATLPYL